MSTTEEFDGPTMTGGALLRQFEPLRREGATLAVNGSAANDLQSAAETFGWTMAPAESASIIAHYAPETSLSEEDLAALTTSHADTLCVVANNADSCTLNGFTLVRSQSLRRYISLNTWFHNTAVAAHIPQGLIKTGASLLRATKVSDVVGSRMCGLKEKQARVARYQRTGSAGEPRQSLQDSINNLAMSFFGIGHLPLFAANFASMAVTLIAVAVWLGGGIELLRPVLVGTLVLSTLLGVILEPWAERYYLAPDAREVVLDEVAGMSLTLLFLPLDAGLSAFVAGFVLFRFFDIFKFGVHWIESVPVRGTVTYDDLIAGLYAGICLWAVCHFLL